MVNTASTSTTVVIGTYEGQTSPVQVLPETLYVDVKAVDDAHLTLPDRVEERAVYVIEGSIDIQGCVIPAGSMAVLEPGVTAEVSAAKDCRFVLVGGEKMSPRHLWWNFVHTSPAAIEVAKARWQDQGFGTVPGDEEFIPLPQK